MKCEPDIGKIKNFLQIVEQGSFTDAAEALHITQPSLSRQITCLEQMLNMTLLKRSKSGVELTEEGAEVYSLCHDLIDAYNRFITGIKEIDNYRHTVMGTLNIGVPRSGESWVLQYHLQFLQMHKKVKIKIFQQPRHSVFDDLNASLLDAAYICGNEVRYSGRNVRSMHVASMKNMLLVPRGNPLFKRDKVQLSELKDEPFVISAPDSYPSRADEVVRACKAHGFIPNVVYHASNIAEYVMATVGYGGIAILPYLPNIEEPGNLRYIELDGFDVDYPIRLVWNAENRNPALQHYVDCIKSGCDSRLAEISYPTQRSVG